MKLCAGIAWFCILAAMAAGGITQTNETSTSEIGFAASNLDLINSGSTTLGSASHSGYSAFTLGGYTSSAANLNDGSSGSAYSVVGNPAESTVAFDLDGAWTSTFTLNTSVNVNGYDLASIQTISGWPGGRRNQQFELLISTVSSPGTFTSYGTYSYSPGGDGGARITLTDSGGTIATNVSSVRFSVQNAGTVYREFDVFGSPSGSPPPPPPPPPTSEQLVPDDSRITYSDYARLVTLDASVARFDRVISGAQGSLQNANPAARVRFRTDATSVTASFSTGSLGITQGIGVILIDGARAGTFDASANNSTLNVNVPVSGGGYHNVELLLPYSQDVRFTGLTVNGGAAFQTPPARPGTRWVAYGDSITEGFSAGDSYKNYPSLVGVAKDWEVVNMGFGWRGIKDSGATGADGTVVGGLGADVISVMMGYNDAAAGLSAANYRAYMEAFVAKVRDIDGSVPIYLISPIYSTNNGTTLGGYRDELIDFVNDSTDPRLYFIDGLALGINSSNSGTYLTDGIHPNDAGFALIASNLAGQLAVPEPTTIASVLGLGSLALLRRRRNRK
jgi:lysophospholipase L1-like esterase